MRTYLGFALSICALAGLAGCVSPQVSPTQPVECVYLPPGYELPYDKWSPYPVCPPLLPVVLVPGTVTTGSPGAPGAPTPPTPSTPAPAAEQSAAQAGAGADAVEQNRDGSWEGTYSGGGDGAGAYEGGTSITVNARGLQSQV